MKKPPLNPLVPLAVTSTQGMILLFSKRLIDDKTILVFQTSKTGEKFSKKLTPVTVVSGRKEIDPENIFSMRVSVSIAGFVASIEIIRENVHTDFSAESSDGKKWKILRELPRHNMAPVARGRTLNPQALYYSDKAIWVKVIEKKLKKESWSPARLIAAPRRDGWDNNPLRIVGISRHLIVYDSPSFTPSSVETAVGVIAVSAPEFDTVVSRSKTPLWYGKFEKTTHLEALGVADVKGQVTAFWKNDKNEVIAASLGNYDRKSATPYPVSKVLKRAKSNPILAPREDVDWEANGTFNPGAFVDDVGHTHLFYRAIGTDGVSRIGHAESVDGIHFRKRSVKPVYEEDAVLNKRKVTDSAHRRFDPAYYTSGGSWSGSEDPRTVLIDGRVYMLYVAFEGWNSIRIVLTSIDLQDLKNGRWLWTKPVFLSPPNEVVKNWLLFPNRIKGKYAIVHSIVPDVLIKYVDNLKYFNGKRFIESPRLRGPQPGRNGFWDSIMRGPAAPPLQTKIGWLLLYHAIDKRDPGKYKLGAMILDKNNPEKILHRSVEPVLAPDMYYENDGKPGVVYASGAVIRDDTLYIYYGGGDRVVCVATAPLETFLEEIKKGKPTTMQYRKVILNH